MIDRKPAARFRPGKWRSIAWIGLGGFLALLLAGHLVWKHRFHQYTPVDALKDLRAASQLGDSTDRVHDFLELRYGPQTDPANRQQAIVDFFNPGHIEGLYLIVGHKRNAQAQAVIADVARTIADYRDQMTPEEKAALGDYFRSDAGRAQIQNATAFYLAKDAGFRSITAPVIKELLTTLAVTH